MKTKLIAPLFLISMFAQGCVVVSDDGDSYLTIVNDSPVPFTGLYITEAYDGTSWGPNLLAGAPLDPGTEIEVEVDCGTYDVQIITSDGYVCEYFDEDLCFDDDLWYVLCGPPVTSTSESADAVNESTASNAAQ